MIVGREVATLSWWILMVMARCLMVNFIFCCGFINCFFLSELNICDTDFRLARFYLLLERFFFYFLEPNVELRDFVTRIWTYFVWRGCGFFFVGRSPSCYCMTNTINCSNRTYLADVVGVDHLILHQVIIPISLGMSNVCIGNFIFF